MSPRAQVYQGLNIGSNKVRKDHSTAATASSYSNGPASDAQASDAERAAVPHHLLDIITPAERYTAGQFVRDAQAAIADVASRGKLPVVVGGDRSACFL